jgi:ABC-type lipoprotein export system ATPase subunit
VQTLRERYGMTVLMVTNDDDIAELADRRLRLRDGLIRDAAPRSAPA